jgi:hypothetical protein
MLTLLMTETFLQPGWQICKRLERPRDTVGTATFYLVGEPDALGFFESVALAGLEDCWIRLPAPAQRHFFGKVLFGNKAIKVSNDGKVTVFWTVAFGRDFERVELRYDQFRRLFHSDNHPECVWKGWV